MNRRMAASRAFRVISAATVLLTFGVSGCTSGPDEEPQGDTADAYVVVLRWFVDNAAVINRDQDEIPVVFVDARGEGVDIGLETQAHVVEAANEFADVRFIDDRSEAMNGDVVRDGVILLAIGPAVGEAATTRVACDQIFGDNFIVSWAFELRYGRDGWVLTADPVSLN